jgi:chromosome partition protein MukF
MDEIARQNSATNKTGSRPSPDLHRVLGSLHQARAALELDTAHLCYLIALRVRAEQSNLASLTEDELVDLYLQVSELLEPDAVNPRLRATHAIQHLRNNRLLRRVDGAGLVRAGEYALSRLAVAIVDFFIEDETLTRENLAVLTRALTSQLGMILANAQRAETDDEWRADVVEPLRVTVSDLVAGIERRQRGMDAQQEEVRERISALLQEDWFAAVDECELLLEETSTTLRELNEVLLHDSAHLQALLQDIENAANEARATDAVAQAQKVQEHLDRVTAWGGDRQRAWSDYYQFVQRYLRGVVRLDPDRAVSQRLRHQLANWLDRPFALVVAGEPSIRLLRDEQAKVDRPPVTRRHAEREQTPQLVPPDRAPVALAQGVDEALADGHSSLVAVAAQVLPEMPRAEQYRAAGQLASLVAERVKVSAPLERSWTSLEELDLELQDWDLQPRSTS